MNLTWNIELMKLVSFMESYIIQNLTRNQVIVKIIIMWQKA